MATETQTTEEHERAAYLLDAQTKAVSLFEEIERNLIRPGVSEKDLSNEVHELGAKRHGVRIHRTASSNPTTSSLSIWDPSLKNGKPISAAPLYSGMTPSRRSCVTRWSRRGRQSRPVSRRTRI